MRKHFSIKRNRLLFAAVLACTVVSLFMLSSKTAPPVSAEPETAAIRKTQHFVGTSLLTNLINIGIGRRKGDPVEVKAVNFAESVPVRDLPPAKAEKSTRNMTHQDIEKDRERTREKIYKKEIDLYNQQNGIEDGDNEINTRNREIIRKVDPNAKPRPDEALSSNNPFSPSPNPPNPPSLTFESMSSTDSTCGCLPPDTNGEVGPNHFVATVNTNFRIFDKTGAPLTSTATFSSLFGPLGAPCGTRNDGDPVVLYDQLADRWLISQFCLPSSPDHQVIAISKTGDPTGAYFLYDFIMPNAKFPDYPKFGMWPDGYYMTDNQFNQAGTAFQGGGVFAFNRAKMLVGDNTASFVYFDTCPTNTNCVVGGMLPSDMDGFTPPAAGTPNTFAFFDSVQFGDAADQLRLFDFHVDFATTANSTFLERTGSPLPVAAFDPRTVPASSRNVIPQPSGTALDAISDRLMFRLSYRNFGSSESLILNHTVNALVNPSFQAGVRWYQLRRTTPTGAFTIAEQQTFAPNDSVHRWMGSGAMNYQGDIAVGFSASASSAVTPSVFPSIRYAAKLSTDPAGSGLAQGEQTVIAGAGAQSSTSGRWGDYSDITVDPSDDCTFWYNQEYYSASGSATWKTRVGKFAPGPCTPSPRGTISGTITNCNTAAPIANALISISGGYSRGTPANGTYSAIVPPNTYSASATAPGYSTVTQNGLVVSNGGNAPFSACLVGVPIMAASSPATITAENGVPANGVPDPGETVTINLPIVNTGTANTTNLVATLQPTGGVTNPSGPQTYGVVVAGGSAVTMPFTFRVSGTCGGILTMTLALQDGATNLGTITYTKGIGAPALGLSQNFDGVTVPALPAGWTQNQTSGTGITWTTVNTAPVNSAPNVAFANDPATVNATAIESPSFPVTNASPVLTFQKSFTTESTFDGVVLEIKIGAAGAWQDILTAGGTFVTGGYNATISTNFSSPIAGRQAWSGSFPAFALTQVNLPASTNGQNIQLRWLMASDSSVASTGFRLDDVQVQSGTICAAVPAKARADFDGDGKTDLSVFRPSEGNWYLNRSTAGFTVVNFGLSTDTLVPSDYDGDGKADIAVFRPSATTGVPDFRIFNSSTSTVSGYEWGTTGDIPVVGDYDGDGKADVAVFRPSEGNWYILRSSLSGAAAVQITKFGVSGDIPVVGDFDGDGKTDLTIYRSGRWYIWFSQANSVSAFDWGLAGDKLVPADYDGDGKTDIATYRPSTGQWFIRRSSDGTTLSPIPTFGNSTDIPVPGDYDGDGKDDTAIYRNGQWWINRSTAGLLVTSFGTSTDTAIPTRYIP